MYCLSLVWDRENTVFFQRREEDDRAALERCPPEKPCVSCGVDFLDEERERWDVLADGSLVQGPTSYHVHDVVYLRPQSKETDVYVIGQITNIHELVDKDRLPTFDVQLLQRYDLAARRANKGNFGNQVYDEVCYLYL